LIFKLTVTRRREGSWNVTAHRDARERKWRENWRMEWVASTLHTTSEHDASNITTTDAHSSVASGRLNWRPRPFKLTRPFCRKWKSGFCACAITFQTHLKPQYMAPLWDFSMACINSSHNTEICFVTPAQHVYQCFSYETYVETWLNLVMLSKRALCIVPLYRKT
jgi:hypothetical protein